MRKGRVVGRSHVPRLLATLGQRLRAGKGSCWLTALMQPRELHRDAFASTAIKFAVTIAGTTRDVCAFPVCPSAEFCHVPPSVPRHHIHALDCNRPLRPGAGPTRPTGRCTSAASSNGRATLRGPGSAHRRASSACRSTAYGRAGTTFRCTRTPRGGGTALCSARAELRCAFRPAYGSSAYGCPAHRGPGAHGASQLGSRRARTRGAASGSRCIGAVAA